MPALAATEAQRSAASLAYQRKRLLDQVRLCERGMIITLPRTLDNSSRERNEFVCCDYSCSRFCL
jgi:hypothetical protein